MPNYDLIIIGGGILGLSHAYHALNKNLKVLLLEKNRKAIDASVRNFGQIVPSGFATEWQNLGRASIRHYLDIANKAKITLRQEGSIYIASDEEEITLIEELHQINKTNGYESVILSPEQCRLKYPSLRNDYCKGGLFYPSEINLESTHAIPAITEFLVNSMGMDFEVDRCIIDIKEFTDKVVVYDTYGHKWSASQAVICNGHQYQLLFPELFPMEDIKIVKLQMMQTVPQQQILPGSILTGHTIRRYESFTECPSYAKIKENEDKSSFQQQYGIHILFKQNSDGSVIIGDSHEYDTVDGKHHMNVIDTSQVINNFIIEEAKKIMDLDFQLMRTWNGFYSQYDKGPIYHKTIHERLNVVTASGGKGMTASLGWAEQHINHIFS